MVHIFCPSRISEVQNSVDHFTTTLSLWFWLFLRLPRPGPSSVLRILRPVQYRGSYPGLCPTVVSLVVYLDTHVNITQITWIYCTVSLQVGPQQLLVWLLPVLRVNFYGVTESHLDTSSRSWRQLDTLESNRCMRYFNRHHYGWGVLKKSIIHLIIYTFPKCTVLYLSPTIVTMNLHHIIVELTQPPYCLIWTTWVEVRKVTFYWVR